MKLVDYFQSHNDYFWQWEEGTDVLAIPKENTIAYREFIVEVLERLSHQGVPPFGSLLLAIIATNPNGKSSIDTVYAILSNALKTTDDTELAHAIEFLKLLTDIPPEYKQGKKRALLFQAIFENCHNVVSIKKSKDILNYFISENFYKGQPAVNKNYSITCARKDIKTIGLLKNRFSDVSQLLDKVKALPDFTEELPEFESPVEQDKTKSLTEQLIDNSKTFYVGSLIKQIWSGLNIPLHSALPSQQPLGGVSDLTNKGEFDKLLISEFANDDLVFLSRLANNEALYVHREIPPAINSLERIILIDVSLKNWGTPKAVSFATMLAIATHPKTDIVCSAFVIGNSFHPVSIQNVDTILEGLQFLEPSLHAADGLTHFFKEHPANKNREIFFITEHSTLKQPAMIKALNDYQPYINYWIFTDNSGNIDIYKKQQSSKKHIQHLQLPLKKLWQKELKKQYLNEETEEMKISNYPLLFRRPPNVKTMMTTSDGQTFMITGDKVLLRFFSSKVKPQVKGWELLIEKLPFSVGEFEMGLTLKGDYILLMFNVQTRELTLLNLTTREKKNFHFSNWKSTSTNGFIFQNQKFYHLNHRGCWAIDFGGIAQINLGVSAMPNGNNFEDRAEEIKKVMAVFRMDQAIFKNLKEVFINENDHLVLNIHELLMNSGSHLKLNITTKKIKKQVATKIRETAFIFPDGSCIEINKAGILLLKSSSNKIPVIYIPAILDSSLAAATETDFAGNEFYYPETLFDVHLIDAGIHKPSVFKEVKELTDLSEQDTKEVIYRLPCRLVNNLPRINAENIKNKLVELGATVEIKLSKPSAPEIKRSSLPFFYQKYIDQFIQHILKNGTQNQAV